MAVLINALDVQIKLFNYCANLSKLEMHSNCFEYALGKHKKRAIVCEILTFL